MAVFGAGASYDSFANARPPGSFENYRLPLANHLFDHQRFMKNIAQFPECQGVIQDLQRPKVDVERELERIQNEAGKNPDRLSQLAAIRYYLQTMLWECQNLWERNVTGGVSNYKTFLYQIGLAKPAKEKVCLVTFNYDTLLEKAVPISGFKITHMSHYISKQYKIVKLHGSVDWAHEVTHMDKGPPDVRIREIIATFASLNADGRISSSEFQVVNGNPFDRGTSPWFPAIAIPVVKKSGFECPTAHVDEMETCLRQVTKVVAVGWRATEFEFLSRMAYGLGKRVPMLVVSSNEESARKTVQRMVDAFGRMGVLRPNIRPAKSEGFSDFVFSQEWKAFLNN